MRWRTAALTLPLARLSTTSRLLHRRRSASSPSTTCARAGRHSSDCECDSDSPASLTRLALCANGRRPRTTPAIFSVRLKPDGANVRIITSVPTSDAELVHRALEGSQTAYQELVSRYASAAVNVAARLVRDRALAEDL